MGRYDSTGAKLLDDIDMATKLDRSHHRRLDINLYSVVAWWINASPAKRLHRAGFQHPIVPGPLSSTFLVRMLADRFPGWRLQTFNISYRAPIRHGGTLSFWGTVTQKDEQQGIATIHCDVIVENGNGDRAIVGTATLQPRLLSR